MVSMRWKKRVTVLVFLACMGVLCFYRMQGNQLDSRENGKAPAFQSFASDEGNHVTTELKTDDDDDDDVTDADDIVYESDSADKGPGQQSSNRATEPQEKIQRGLEDNEEVQETFDWLDDAGASPPPTESLPTESEATTPRRINENTTAGSSEFVVVDKESNKTTPEMKTSDVISGNRSEDQSEKVIESEAAAVSNATWDETSNSSSAQLSSEQATKEPDAQQNYSQPTSSKNTDVSAMRSQTSAQPLDKSTSSQPSYLPTSPRENHSQPTSSKNTDVSTKKPPTSAQPLDQSNSSQPLQLPTSPQQNHSQTSHTEESTKSPPSTHASQSESPTPMYTPTPSLNICKLPKLDPWDPSIRHLLKDVGEDPGCRKIYPVPAFDVVANRLALNGDMNASSINFHGVKVETIHRNDKDDWNVHFIDRGNPFDSPDDESHVSRVINESDFFKLSYRLKTGREDTHYFAQIVPRRDVMEESRKIREEIKQKDANEGLGLNVLMLGFDSVSTASFLRKMPKTLRYLKESLKTYFITGQTVIGDATTPALTAMLTGLYETDPPEGRRGFDNSGPIDKWPWLMRLFKERGYVTMLAEDDPIMGAFNLRLNGFDEPPADHYARPFWLGLEERKERDEPGICSRATFMSNYTLNYALSYFESYPDTPKFAFGFMSYLSHAHPNHLSYADLDVLRLLRTFVKRSYHNNTIIVLFGDHGSRNDDVRNTMQGKLEERLPWLSISVPAWLEKKYPDVASALEHNQRIVTSPFDLHATLHHVLTYPDEPKGEKTRTLFKKLNTTRTCSEAGIGEHWCPCLKFTDVNVSSRHVVDGAKMAVKHINDVILNQTALLRKSCATVQLKKILRASQYKPNEKLQRFSDTNQDSDRSVNFGLPTNDSPHYRINFMTSPGDALFEATVAIVGGNKVVVNPNISRTNVYGNQPRCILRKIPYARKFCYCK